MTDPAKGDEAFVVSGVILPVKDMPPDEISMMEEAGFLRAEWNGSYWLFPSFKDRPGNPYRPLLRSD